jgi:hypothetical protein
MTLTAPSRVPTTDLSEQALFKEARRRRRNRWLITAAVVAAVAAGVLALISASSGGNSRQPAPSTQPTRQAAAAPGPFAGTWQVKYYDVRISSDGYGTATWPIKVDCGSIGASPGASCDTVNRTTGLVHEGGQAQIRIVSSIGDRATGIISGSTEPSVLPDGEALFRVATDDVLYITPSATTTSSPFGRSSFCGPQAAALSFSQQNAEHIDCGS